MGPKLSKVGSKGLKLSEKVQIGPKLSKLGSNRSKIVRNKFKWP